MIKHFITKQFLVFLLVGGFAALLNWLARIYLSTWLPFSSAIIIAYCIGMSVAFTLNHFFVFPTSTKATRTQARDFILVNLSLFPLVWFVSIVVNHWLNVIGIINYSKELAHAIAISSPMIFTFLFYKFVAFQER